MLNERLVEIKFSFSVSIFSLFFHKYLISSLLLFKKLEISLEKHFYHNQIETNLY